LPLALPGLRLAALLLGWLGPPDRAPVADAAPRREDPAEVHATTSALEGATALPAEVARIEAEHRGVLGGPIEGWQLGHVRSSYEELLKRTTDPAAADAVRARLDLVARHEEMARSARAIETILARSRRRDQIVAMTRRRLAVLEREGAQRSPYVVEGLIHPSSREVEGRRVYTLIGADGAPVAYLDIPPGLDARPLLVRRVGVRGSVHYNEALGTRLIAVHDLEPLD
jgi:hypothetical protein